MAIEHCEFRLERGSTEIQVAYVHRGPDAGPFVYMQAIRSPRRALLGSDPTQSGAYAQFKIAKFKAMPVLMAALKDRSFSAVVSPPSSQPFAAELKNALQVPSRIDLTSRFDRVGDHRSALTVDLQNGIDSLQYRLGGDETTIESLLIVDDILASGSTVGAIVSHLRRASLPSSCKIFLACYFWAEP